MYSYVVSPSTHKQILYYWTRIVVVPLMMMAACQKRCSRFLFFFLISILFRDKVFVFIFNTYFEHHLFTIIIIIIWHVISSSFLIVVFAQQQQQQTLHASINITTNGIEREKERKWGIYLTHIIFFFQYIAISLSNSVFYSHTHTHRVHGNQLWEKKCDENLPTTTKKIKKKSNGKMDADHSYTHAPGQWTHRTRKLFFKNFHEQPVYNYNDDDV